jgi:hypothetical protein
MTDVKIINTYQDSRSTLKSKLSTLVDFTNIIEPSSTDNIVTILLVR